MFFAFVCNKLKDDNRGASWRSEEWQLAKNKTANLFLAELSKNFASIAVSNVPAGHLLKQNY